MMRKLTAVLGAAVLGATLPGAGLAQRPAAFSAPARQADLVLLGGKVFTADSTHLWAEAVAIAGERVIAVGTTAEVRRLVGAKTRVYDLGGRIVIPGINDAHQHISANAEGVRVAFGGEGPFPDPSLSVVLDSLAAAVARAPRGTWLLSGGIGESVLNSPAPRDAIDRVVPDHPVFLTGNTGHGAVLNSAALRSLGITDAAADPPGGWLVRDANGRPTGVLHEYGNLNAATRLTSRRADSVHVAAVRAAAASALRLGITSIQDMAAFTAPAPKLRAVRDARPDVRLRVIRMPATDAAGGLDEWRTAERAVPLPKGSMARVAGVKWVLDGTPVERLGAMRAPYADRPEWYGRINFPVDAIRAMLREALAHPPGPDHQLMLHVSGDSSVALVLRLMSELAPDTAWRARRVRLEHADGLMDDLWPLARRLGVIVVQNPIHFATPPEMMAARMGEARAPRYQPLRSLAATGIPIAIGSDGPTNPFLNLMFATLHPNNPAEVLTCEQAITAYTHGAAYAEFAEREKGRLVPGQLADLAVLSQDIFTVAPQALPGTASVLTLVGGRVVHDAGVLAPLAAVSAQRERRGEAAATIPMYADSAQLRAAAQAVVNSLHARSTAAGLDLGPAPTVEVRTTPQLIFYSPSAVQIVAPWWDDLAPEVRTVFARLGGGEAEGQQVFRAFFHRFFIAHEAAHWLRHRSDTRKETLYAGEDDANRIAVAFWRTQPDGEAFLAELERMLVGIVARIPDPTPAGQDPVAFFGANYQELGRDPMKYGYYQFRFVLDAVRERSQLDLATILTGIASKR
jgi:predicted amidohydrolase YtcJ